MQYKHGHPAAKLLLTSFLLITGIFRQGMAQEQNTSVDSLWSNVLQEERHIHIALPDGFKPNVDTPYEVIYILDGFSMFMRTSWTFLQGEGFLPKNMIMVGIDNTIKNGMDMRDRDFTPTSTGSVTGGADKFVAFIKNELMPYINKKYRGKPGGNTLYGGSLGGLLAVYVLMTQPDLFTSYIAIDPALWWDNFYMIRHLPESFTKKTFHNTLYIAGREGRPYHFMGVAPLDSLLQSVSPAGLEWEVGIYKNDTHFSTNFKGFYEGLKFSYGGFYASTAGYPASRNILIKPHFGTVLKDHPFDLICYNLAPYKNIHFTIDGSIPTRSSPKLKADVTPIVLQKDAIIILKSIGMREEYDKSDTAWFTVAQAFPAITKPAGAVQAGLHYSCYEGIWDESTDFNKLTPKQTGITSPDFDVTAFGPEKDYVCILDGFIEIGRDDHYIIEMGDGNDSTKVYLANRQILGRHYAASTGEGYMMPLQKGFYPIRISYVHKKGVRYMEWLYMKATGGDDFPIPTDMLYHSR